jgi:hypothetical protein
LKAFDGSDPFAWNPAGQHVGHVLMLVGCDENFNGHGQTLVVHDPLRGLLGQPWDYSPASVQAAGAKLIEVVAAPLAKSITPPPAPIPPPPPPAPDPLQELQDLLNQANAKLADYKAQLDKDTAALADAQSKLQSVKTWLGAMPNF